MEHPISPWIVKHSVWVLNRFRIHDAGLSSFHRRYRTGPLPGLAGFWGASFFRAHGKHVSANTMPLLNPGFWFGHLVITSAGVFKSRTMKMMQPSESFSCVLLKVPERRPGTSREAGQSTSCSSSCRGISRSSIDNRPPRRRPQRLHMRSRMKGRGSRPRTIGARSFRSRRAPRRQLLTPKTRPSLACHFPMPRAL